MLLTLFFYQRKLTWYTIHKSSMYSHIFNICKTLLNTHIISSHKANVDFDIRNFHVIYYSAWIPKRETAKMTILLILCALPLLCVNGSILESDMSQTLIYYEPRSRLPLRITSIQNSLSNSSLGFHQSNTKVDAEVVLRRFGFRSNGCTCQEFSCGCCAGFNFQQFNFNREGCMKFTYNPYEFSISVDMYMNEDSIFSTTFSARNPPPFCIPVALPFLPMVDFCAKLLDIYTPGQNLHMCLDFETRIQRATVLVLHFNCMRMGVDGVTLIRPGESSGGLPVTTEPQVDVDKYDEITEIKYKSPKPR
ncbi:hypothetical protein RI129_011924 [Pyrocoelia pectoralis]|uniref:DUF4773 domain-containing protein n=1 Tax=Pyrocoelia pectoralis TaxID=417401 RepID=A0AAN7V185_9COLE